MYISTTHTKSNQTLMNTPINLSSIDTLLPFYIFHSYVNVPCYLNWNIQLVVSPRFSVRR